MNTVDLIIEVDISSTEIKFLRFAIGIPELIEKGILPTDNLKNVEEYFNNKFFNKANDESTGTKIR